MHPFHYLGFGISLPFEMYKTQKTVMDYFLDKKVTLKKKNVKIKLTFTIDVDLIRAQVSNPLVIR